MPESGSLLESEPSPSAPRRSRYAQPLAFYENVFQVSNRTIKGWIAIGRDARPVDLPPLDAPQLMSAWYAKHKKNRVPDHLVALACGHVDTPKPPSPPPPLDPLFAAAAASAAVAQPPAAPPVLPPPVPPPPLASASSQGSRGYTATLEALRDAAALAGQRYASLAAQPAKEAEAEQARRAWQQIVKEQRAYEKDAEDVLQKTGQAWVAADVIATLQELHISLRDAMLSLYDRLEPQLEPLSSIQRRRLYRDEVRRLFGLLVAHRFTQPPAQAAQAAA